MTATHLRTEAGFTLVEVLVASAIFVFVALAGFETVRALGASVAQLAQRATAAARLAIALEELRSNAASASAVWVPHSACGAAVSMMRRVAGGTSFTTYVLRGSSFERTTATGPIDPCNPALTLDPVLDPVATFSATAVAADSLPSHVDPVSGHPDGATFTAGIPAVAIDSHVRDFDGTPILGGNGIVEISLDADPAEATVDLVAGNRPSGYTDVLTYACGPRCAANAPFAEIAGLDYADCEALAPDLPDSAAYYVPSATGVGAGGAIVTTAYAIHLRYGFTFDGGASQALTVYRVGPTFTWPAAATLSDPYPVDYANNSVKATGAVALAAFAGAPANLASDDALCSAMSAEADFHG